ARQWWDLGRARAGYGRRGVGGASLGRAGALARRSADLAIALADLLLQQNKAAEALDACRRAVSAEPDNVHAAVTEALLLPPIYASAEDLEQWRNRFTSGLSSLRARESRWQHKPRGVLTVEATNFYLAYQGGDDLALQSGY